MRAQAEGVAPAPLTPISEGERLVALDILRAVALLGVFLMNVEYFTRPLETVGYGIQPGLLGANYAVAWFEYVFLLGKFWTVFALLFGMGFAVMAERAERARRSFATTYLRRTGALLAFGVAHMVLVWAGDILHTYALAACVLLMILRGRPWWLLLPVPLFLVGAVTLGGRAYLGGAVAFVLFAGACAWLRGGGAGRLWRAGAMLYASVPVVVLTTTLVWLLSATAPTPERQALAAQRIAEDQAAITQAATVNVAGSYADNVALRLDFLLEGLAAETYLLVLAIGMFLIGVWFIRSGVLRDPAANRPLFRRLARVGLSLGVALALCSVAIATAYDPLHRNEFTIAAQLMQLANLPLSLGYVGALMLLLHRRGDGLRLEWLAPVGRMALTNYLLQSAVGTLVFYGYGLGLWGRIDRLGQLLLVLAVFALQVAASRWWLSRFRFGPMEWLWRAITYGGFPPLRREAPAHLLSTAPGSAN